MKIKAKNLSVDYSNKKVLEKLNFELDKNEFIAIIGPNGAGKSTLLKTISQLITPSEGVVYLDKRDLKEISKKELARIRAFVSAEEHISNEFLSVKQYLSFGRAPYQNWLGSFKPEDQKIIDKAITETGITELLEKNLSEISSGEKQRIQIARALVQAPEILLLDEPTSHLDIKYQLEIMSLLKNISRKGVKVITIIHDFNLAAYFCDRLMLLNNTEIVSFDKPSEVLTGENLEMVFGNKWDVVNNNVTGIPKVYPRLEHKNMKLGDNIKLHIIGGGGTATDIIKELEPFGFYISLGIINILDSDYLLAVAQNLEVITEEPFSPIKESTRTVLRNKLAETDYIYLTDVPFGEGNLANLEELLIAEKEGKAVIFQQEDFSGRDFTGGKATEIWRLLKPQFRNITDFISFIRNKGEQSSES